jgi:regulator of sigma E protease
VHELGHFLSAKKSGIKVEEFGFGFPPRIAGIKKGETIYSINWIPLGGFVKIKGESGEYAKHKDSFGSKSAGRRAFIIGAGVIMNFVLAWGLFSVGYLFGLPRIIDENLPFYARTSQEKLQVIGVLEGSPADEAELEMGDTIVAIDEEPIETFEEFSAIASSSEGKTLTVTLLRAGETINEEITPEFLEKTQKPGVGVAIVKTGLVSFPLIMAPVEGARATALFTKEIVSAIFTLVGDLFRAAKPSIDFSGPVGIAIITGEVARLGLRHLLQFTALLSINLAIINILPVPALDGGRLMFLIVEKLRGKAVDRKVEAVVHNIGFLLLMLLVLVVTYRDVVRFGDRIIKAFGGLLGA